ncbi:MAG: hypothetical protein KDA33_02790, partial [Phycisphaerales bacterium]|nr:hypothetical protein [Phycisphaerales bacterium]
MKRFFTRQRRTTLALVMISLAGCSLFAAPACTLELPSFDLSSGSPFLIKGTFVRVERFGQAPCFAWEGDNGIFYHLFQDANLDDDLFDQATTVGARSRLLIQIRGDLQVTCELGP